MSPAHPITDPTTITVYGADWCGDCRRSKRLLARRGVAFTWIDVKERPEVRDELRASGYRAIPVIALPDGAILVEPSDADLSAAIDALGGQPAG